MEQVSVVEFSKPAGPYRTGDHAGFDPELAQQYVARGFGKIVQANVPRVDPSVVAHGVARRIEELRALLTAAERDAKGSSDGPNASATAAEALSTAQSARAAIDALARQVAGAGTLTLQTDRKPVAAGRAA